MTDAVIHVAVDGSSGSHRALAWALSEAGIRECAVEVVTAYRGQEEPADAARERAERNLRTTVDEVVAGRSALPKVSWRAVEGEPAEVLVRESSQSQLLVMGSHGVQGLRHSALGSVADTCARMAECPVVIIPPDIHGRHLP